MKNKSTKLPVPIKENKTNPVKLPIKVAKTCFKKLRMVNSMTEQFTF
jgi:hypothetical protein